MTADALPISVAAPAKINLYLHVTGLRGDGYHTLETLVAFANSWGLFYLIALAIGVLIYTFWPSNRRRFQDAKKSILDEDDKPWM